MHGPNELPINKTIGSSLIATFGKELFNEMLLLLTKSWVSFGSFRFMLKDGSSSHQLHTYVRILVMLVYRKPMMAKVYV